MPIALLSAGGVAAAWIGFSSIKVSHGSYRRAILKKTLIEDRLGLTRRFAEYNNENATGAIGTTWTQADTKPILHGTDAWLDWGIRHRTVVVGLRIFLAIVGVLHAANNGWQAWLLYGHP